MTKKIVVPGELIGENSRALGEHVYKLDNKVYSDSVGIVNENESRVDVVPLSGVYKPKQNDFVIGVVLEEKATGYVVDINSFYPLYLSKKDVYKPVRSKAVISARVYKVNEVNEVILSDVREFQGGEIIDVTPVKVPRIIGKSESMLKVLKDNTGASIFVGRNGRVWMKGENLDLVTKGIRMIEKLSHTSNLTNKVDEFLKGELNGRK